MSKSIIMANYTNDVISDVSNFTVFSISEWRNISIKHIFKKYILYFLYYYF